MALRYLHISLNHATGLRATPVISASSNQTPTHSLYTQTDAEMIEELSELRAFAAALSATGADAEIIPLDQAIREIENGRR